jgi:predicted esterase
MRASVTLEPLHVHLYTIVALHGFNSSAVEFRDKVKKNLPTSSRSHALVLFLNAPMRKITCYDNAWVRSWHDYYTNYGDYGEDREEHINLTDLRSVETSLIMFIKSYMKTPIVLLGESQGACVALHVGLEHDIPTISLYGHLYSHSTVLKATPVYALAGKKDCVISARLIAESLKKANSNIVVSSNSHAEMNEQTRKFLKYALQSFEAALG